MVKRVSKRQVFDMPQGGKRISYIYLEPNTAEGGPVGKKTTNTNTYEGKEFSSTIAKGF